MFEYNSKIDYLFAKKLIDKDKIDKDELHKRSVFNGKEESISNYDILLKSMKSIIDYIKDDNTIISVQSIKHIIKLLGVNDEYKIINNEIQLEELIDDYNNSLSSNSFDLFVNLFVNNIFGSNIELFIIPTIYNFTRENEKK